MNKKPRNYWNYEHCCEESLKYTSRAAFSRGSSGAYAAACKFGWLDDFDWLVSDSKPDGYWNYETCFEEAKKYTCVTEFSRGSSGAYDKAMTNKWLKDYTWFKRPENYNKKWNQETCFEEAKKYNNRSAFMEGSVGAYQVALKNGWLDDYSWMKRPEAKNRKWTLEICLEEAKKYGSMKAFRENNKSAYEVCVKNHWLDNFNFLYIDRAQRGTWDVYENCYNEAKKYKTLAEFIEKASACYQSSLTNDWIKDYTWLEREYVARGTWQVYENCYNEALKYKTRHEFKKGANSAYHSARIHGWLESFVWLKDERIDMIKGKIDCVYVYEFKDLNSVYVGRTLMKRKRKRDIEHLFKEDTVSRFARANDVPLPEMKILEENLSIKEGAEHEALWIEKYKEEGWNILNKAKAGSLGGLNKIKWTKESCYNLALECKTIREFKKRSYTAYEKSIKNKWANDYVWMVPDTPVVKASKPRITLSEEECRNEALKYDTLTKFHDGYYTTYRIAKENGYLKDYTWFKKRETLEITKEQCEEISRKYITKKEFSEAEPSIYRFCLKKGYIDEFVWLKSLKTHWTYETCYAVAKEYNSRNEFKKGNESAYAAARANGWINDYIWLKPKLKHWTYEECLELAKQYKTKAEFLKNEPKAFASARHNGWMNKFDWLLDGRLYDSNGNRK